MGQRRARHVAAGRKWPLARRSLAVLVAFLLGLCPLALPLLTSGAQAQAPEIEAGGEALISADSVTYDEGLGIVTARGNVEISQGGRVLLADSISYNVNTDVVTASGNVALVEATGDVFFANYMEVTGDLKEGFVRDIRVLMADRSRLAANSGTRVGGNYNEFNKAVYSPCELCKEDPTRAPLWQIKARKVVWDQEEKIIRYEHVTFEFFGVPIAYTPYFEHPDPTVQRKSGFLTPTMRGNEQLGLQFEIPYFIVLSDTADMTLSPNITTKQGVVAAGEYRQLFEKGDIRLDGSATIADYEKGDGEVDHDRFRGHIHADGDFDYDKSFRYGFNINATTDDTYMRVYGFGSQSALVSRVYGEGFGGRSYASVNNYAFQSLRDGVNDKELPIVLPLGRYQYIGEPDSIGGVWRLDASLMSLFRLEGRDVRRVSLAGAWEVPYTTDTGHVFNLTARMEADGYWASEFDPGEPENITPDDEADEFAGRFFPELAVQWRYPLVRRSESLQQIIEPIAQIRLAPPEWRIGGIPNEDSLDLEFDDSNLFSLNRYPGIDKIDDGPRVDYGLKWTALGDHGGYTSIFVGQSWRLLDSGYPDGSGLENQLSDIVGRIESSPAEWLDLTYRFRMSPDTFRFDQHELALYAGVPELNLSVGYLFSSTDLFDDDLFDEEDQQDEGGREELYVRVGTQFTDHWAAFASHRQDIDNGRPLETRFGIEYEDECISIQGIFERTNFRDREVEPENAFFVKIALRNLGEIDLQ
ncbi:MAG TPA: LPS assembly protein LptD [Kiloniellales bacterium]|nr:LPS assembly protein LptD [Kiloniellales bacterium]